MTQLLIDELVAVRGGLGRCRRGLVNGCVVVGYDAAASSEAALAYAGGCAERNRGRCCGDRARGCARGVRRWRSAHARWSALIGPDTPPPDMSADLTEAMTLVCAR